MNQHETSAQDRQYRLTIDLSKRERATLEKLRAATGESSSNLVRFGLHLLEYLVSQAEEGARFTLMRDDRQVDILLPFSLRGPRDEKKEKV